MHQPLQLKREKRSGWLTWLCTFQCSCTRCKAEEILHILYEAARLKT